MRLGPLKMLNTVQHVLQFGQLHFRNLLGRIYFWPGQQGRTAQFGGWCHGPLSFTIYHGLVASFIIMFVLCLSFGRTMIQNVCISSCSHGLICRIRTVKDMKDCLYARFCSALQHLYAWSGIPPCREHSKRIKSTNFSCRVTFLRQSSPLHGRANFVRFKHWQDLPPTSRAEWKWARYIFILDPRFTRRNLHVAHGLAMSRNERRSPRGGGERVCDTPQCGWPSVARLILVTWILQESTATTKRRRLPFEGHKDT